MIMIMTSNIVCENRFMETRYVPDRSIDLVPIIIISISEYMKCIAAKLCMCQLAHQINTSLWSVTLEVEGEYDLVMTFFSFSFVHLIKDQ